MSIIFRGVIIKKTEEEQQKDKDDLKTWRAWKPESDMHDRRSKSDEDSESDVVVKSFSFFSTRAQADG